MSNNFLLFNTNGLNMLSDDAYSTDGERLNGVAQGISRSILFNKVLRQSSAMSAALGQVISERGFDALDNNQNSLIEGIKLSFPQNRSLPVGIIIPTSNPDSSNPPEGFLFPNGEPFDPVKYGELAEIYRTGPNSYFYGQVQKSAGVWWPKTPDLRGLFIRGINTLGGIDRTDGLGDTDQNRVIGSYQEDTFKSHVHSLHPDMTYDNTSHTYTGYVGKGDVAWRRDVFLNTNATGDLETRPRNIALPYLIVASSGFNSSISPGGSSATTINLTIASTDWEDSSVTKQVEGVTQESNIDMGLPVPTTLDNSQAISTAGLVITALGDGTITFSCKIVPSVDINLTLKLWSN